MELRPRYFVDRATSPGVYLDRDSNGFVLLTRDRKKSGLGGHKLVSNHRPGDCLNRLGGFGAAATDRPGRSDDSDDPLQGHRSLYLNDGGDEFAQLRTGIRRVGRQGCPDRRPTPRHVTLGPGRQVVIHPLMLDLEWWRWRLDSPIGAESWRPMEGLVDRVPEPTFLCAAVAEPGSRPDAVEVPAQPVEHLLCESVAVAGDGRSAVGFAIALDAEDVFTRMVRVPDADVDTEAACADVSIDFVPPSFDGYCHHVGDLAHCVVGVFCVVCGEDSGASELQVTAQVADSFVGCRCREGVRNERGDHFDASPRSGDGDVQSSPPASFD